MVKSKKVAKFLVFAFLLALPLGQLGRISYLNIEVNVYIYDVFAVLIFLFVLLLLFSRGFSFLAQLDSVVILIFNFSIFAFISLLYNFQFLSLKEFAISFMYLIRFVSYASSYILTYFLAKREEVFKDHIFKVLVFCALAAAFSGFFQLVLFPDFAKLNPSLGWDPHYKRLAGTFFDPNFMGAFLVLGFNLVLSRLFTKKKATIVDLLCSSLLVLGIFLTFSRSAWLFLAISVLIFGILKRPSLLFISLVLAFSAYFFVPRVQTRLSGITDPADSARFRVISWRHALEVFKLNPIFGVGFNSYRYAQARLGLFSYKNPLGNRSGAGSDSSFLFVLATTGVLGFVIYMFLYLNLLIRSYKKRNTLFGLAIFVSLVGLFFESLFINSLFYPQIMGLVWVLSAI